MKKYDTTKLEALEKIKSTLGRCPKMAAISLEILDKIQQLELPDSEGWGFIDYGAKTFGQAYLLRAYLSGVKSLLSKRIGERKRKRESLPDPQQSLLHPEAYETLDLNEDWTAQLDASVLTANLKEYFLKQRMAGNYLESCLNIAESNSEEI